MDQGGNVALGPDNSHTVFDAMSDKFGVILDPEVGGWTDKTAGWADAGQFQVRTRSLSEHLGQVNVRTGSVS